MSEENPNIIEVSTELVEPITISPSEHKAIIYPGQSMVWTVTVKNAEDAPTYKMIYGFSIGYLPPTGITAETVTRSWKLNGEPFPSEIPPLPGGKEHIIEITLTVSPDANCPLTLMLKFSAYRSEMVETQSP